MMEFQYFQLCAEFQRALLNRSENILLYPYFLATLYIKLELLVSAGNFFRVFECKLISFLTVIQPYRQAVLTPPAGQRVLSRFVGCIPIKWISLYCSTTIGLLQ
jgi:hypothetical protein